MIPAVIICAALIPAATAGTAALYLATRKPPKHARPRSPHTHRHAFADPRDHTDPDGTLYIADLGAGLPRRQPVPRQAVSRHAPGLATLATVLDKLRNLPPAPVPDGKLPHAVRIWGMTASDLTADLAKRHLGTTS